MVIEHGKKKPAFMMSAANIAQLLDTTAADIERLALSANIEPVAVDGAFEYDSTALIKWITAAPKGMTLKQLRAKHELSQDDAARLVHVTQRSWARYEAGDRTPPEGLLELFCLKLGEKYPDAISKGETQS